MKNVIDHLNRQVSFSFPPKKIVSLAPAITETLYHLSLSEEIVGRTRFCKYPEHKVTGALNVGGTKEIKLERIHSLKPELIIVEKEENTKEIVETLEKYYPVFVFEVQSIDDSLRMIQHLGQLTNRKSEAESLQQSIEQAFSQLPQINGKRAAYMIWQQPYMVVGKHTYIQSMLQHMGFINPFENLAGRYPVVTMEQLQNTSLDYLFLATEPFPFQEKHVTYFNERLPNVKTVIIDGERFWYGAKATRIVPYFQRFFTQLK